MSLPDVACAELTLLDELLEAHADTVQLALESALPLSGEARFRWCCHVDYLQALQRKGHALLAARDDATRAAQRSGLRRCS